MQLASKSVKSHVILGHSREENFLISIHHIFAMRVVIAMVSLSYSTFLGDAALSLFFGQP